MVAVLLSLLAAGSYGLGDFFGGVFSRRVNPWAIALMAELGGTLAVLLLVPLTGGAPTATDLAWSVLAGIGNGVGTAALYRGLASGRMGVVAPVSAVGSALVPVLVAAATGERPGALVWLGAVFALPGIWFVAREPADHLPDAPGTPPAQPAQAASGLRDGIIAGIGFGTLFTGLAQVHDGAGLLPLALNQFVGGVVIIAIATVMHVDWRPREPLALAGVISGLLGALATAAFMLAAQTGYLTVAAVITSLYPAVTVLLAAAVLRERIHPGQALGLLLCGAAIALVASG